MYIIFFLFLFKHIDRGNSLKLLRRGGSNDYPQSMFEQEYEQYQNYKLKTFSFWSWNFQYIWIGVFSWLGGLSSGGQQISLSTCAHLNVCWVHMQSCRKHYSWLINNYTLLIDWLFGIYISRQLCWNSSFMNRQSTYNSDNNRKRTFDVCSTKAQITQRIPAVYSESSLFEWGNFASLTVKNVPSEDSDQIARCTGWFKSSPGEDIRR